MRLCGMLQASKILLPAVQLLGGNHSGVLLTSPVKCSQPAFWQQCALT